MKGERIGMTAFQDRTRYGLKTVRESDGGVMKLSRPRKYFPGGDDT